MRKKSKLNKEDIKAFESAVKGTKPLATRKKVRLTPRKSPVHRRPVKSEPDEAFFNFSDSSNLPEVEAEEFLTYKHISVSNKILRKLRKGQYNVDAVLDLHGKTVEEARSAVQSFLQHNLINGARVVLVIHGKGHHGRAPILKNKLNHWLREINMVLAFCSAAPSHGSRGATYVLLKRLL